MSRRYVAKVSDRVERDELLAAIELYVNPGPLDTLTGLFGREPFQQLAEYERRAERTASDLRKLLAIANRIKRADAADEIEGRS